MAYVVIALLAASAVAGTNVYYGATMVAVVGSYVVTGTSILVAAVIIDLVFGE